MATYSPETDYYAILGVSANAETKAINTAYRKLVKKYHPDKHKLDDSNEEMAAINAAYEALSTPAKRREYDAEREFYFLAGGWKSEPGARAKEALWARESAQLAWAMGVCKNKYFSGKATIIENDTLLRIPSRELAKATLPNVVCQGDGEVVGIWCESDGTEFIVAIRLSQPGYTGIRRFVRPENLADALNDCTAEIAAIKKIGRTL
jgi:hypothetical protein